MQKVLSGPFRMILIPIKKIRRHAIYARYAVPPTACARLSYDRIGYGNIHIPQIGHDPCFIGLCHCNTNRSRIDLHPGNGDRFVGLYVCAYRNPWRSA